MRNITVCGLVTAFVVATGGIARADTFEVPWQKPTIGDALAAAGPGDTILVYGPGSPTKPSNTVYRSFVVPAGSDGITLRGDGNPVIDGTGSAARAGIEVQATGVTVQGFTVQGFTEFGVLASGIFVNYQTAASPAAPPLTATVRGNRLIGNTNGIIIFGRADPGTAQTYTVLGNTCAGNWQYGIELYATDGTSIVAGNALSGNGWFGVYLNVANGCTVCGNLLTENGTPNAAGPIGGGIGVVDSGPGYSGYSRNANLQPDFLTGNLIANNAGTGIRVTSSTSVTVADNLVYGSDADGILLSYYTTGCLVTANTVVGNGRTDAPVGASYAGIHLSSLSPWDVLDTTGNTITYNEGEANHAWDAQDDVWKNSNRVANKWRYNDFWSVDPSFLR